MGSLKDFFKSNWEKFIKILIRSIFNFLFLLVVYFLIVIFKKITHLFSEDSETLFTTILDAIHQGGLVIIYIIITGYDIYEILKNEEK